MQEITEKKECEPTVIRVIDTKRTGIAPAQLDRIPEPITGKEYRRMLRKAWFSCGVSIGINFILAIAVYILQAGPI